MIRFFRYTFLALALCTAVNAYADHETFTVTLDGAQANAGAGTGSEATGKFFLAYNEDDMTLRIWGTHNVENVTAAHIHHGARGVDGPVERGFNSPASPIDVQFQLDQNGIDSLRTGHYYINVHSQAFPTGEIRGQIEKTTTDLYEGVTYTFSVIPWQAGIEGVPAIPVGNFEVYLGAGRDVMVVSWEHAIENVTEAGIHRGHLGESGATLFPLPTVQEETAVLFCSPDDVNDLLAGNLYVNLATEAYPNGVARGQVIQSMYDFGPAVTYTFKADGAQANGGQGTGSQATGEFFCTLNELGSELTVYGIHNVQNATVAHIHRGAPGENGPVVFGFSSGQSPIREQWLLAPGDLDDLMAGNLYINIHSEAFPAGEIRGQLVMTDVDVAEPTLTMVSLDGEQAAAGGGTGSSAFGFGYVWVNADSSVVYLLASHTAAHATAAHVHNGARGVNGPVIMPLHVNIATIDGAWFTTPAEAALVLSGNTYLNVHTTAFGAGEIRGQIDFNPESVENPTGTPVPVSAELISAFPNPFNSAVKISVNMAARGQAMLAVYDLAGREVARLYDDALEAGSHSFVWNAEGLSTGIYLAKFEAAGKATTMKLVLTK